MLIDNLAFFANNFDLDQETGTFLFTNQIDLSVARNVGAGKQMYVVFVVTEAFTDGGDAAALTLRLVSDDSASIHETGRSPHVSVGPFLKAALTLGTRIVMPLHNGGVAFEKFLGVQAVVGTAGFDAGMITAFLTFDGAEPWRSYPDALPALGS